MSKLAIFSTLDTAPGKRDEVLALLMAHRTRCLRDEPGTLQFEILVPRADDSKLFVLEVYLGEDGREAHRNAPSMAQWRKESAGMIAARSHGQPCDLV